MKRFGQRKQSGFSMIQLLLATIIGAILLVIAIRVAMGQRADVQFNSGISFMTDKMETALFAYYHTHDKSFTGLGGATFSAAAAKGSLSTRYGFDPNLPWGDPWSVQDVTATQVTLDYACGTLRAGCDELDTLLKAMMVGDSMMTSVAKNPASGTATSVRVAYGKPR